MVNDGILLDRYITTGKPIKLTYGDEPENGGFGNRTVDFWILLHKTTKSAKNRCIYGYFVTFNNFDNAWFFHTFC